MTADEFIRVASITLDEVRKAREQGADRARGRIRRALAKAIKAVTDDHWDADCTCVTCVMIRAFDAATRAKRGKRK